MHLGNSFLFKTYKNIRDKLPDEVMGSMKKMIPAYFISSLFEIFGLFILFPVINIIINPANIQKSHYLSILYTDMHFPSSISFVMFLLSGITILFILKNILCFFVYKFQSNIAFNLAGKIALEKYISYLNKPFSFHSNSNTALLLRNFVQLPTDLISYAVLPFFNIVNELFILFLIVAGIGFYDPLLFLSLLLFSIPCLMIYNIIYQNKLKKNSRLNNSAHSSMYKTGMQSMEGYREIVIYGKKKYFKSLFQKDLDIYTKTAGEGYLINVFSPKIVETAAVLAIFCIFIFGYFLNKNLSALANFLIIFSIAAYRIIPSINKLVLSFNYIKSSVHVFDYFDKEDFNQHTIGNKVESNSPFMNISFQNEIEIKDLYFKFPGHEQNVLDGINLIIPKNSIIGIVGDSGSGKTTLLNIFMRLFEEQEGGIFIDNIKIDRTQLENWYKMVSYVPQNTILLDGTITDNIAFGIEKGKVDLTLLADVAEKCLLTDFIKNLQDGFNTQIGEKGIKISGGQRQRIGIARALYNKGSVLIFDEATSSLDYETEKMVTASIVNISRSKELTIIIVAHHIQTLEHCDRIYKLENGIFGKAITYNTLVAKRT